MKLQLVVLNLVVILCTACADECPPGMFQCGNGDCIKNCDICDSKPDCPDDSDENQDCNPCGHFGFQCADGQCTDLDYVCDGKDDCADGSDERDANGDCPSCPTHSIQCLHNGRETCVPKCWICDRYIDCDGSSDEPEGCEMTVSPVNPSSVPFF